MPSEQHASGGMTSFMRGALDYLSDAAIAGAVIVLDEAGVTDFSQILHTRRVSGFPDPSALPRDIALVLIADAEPSIALPWLVHLYPRLVEGGVLAVLDPRAGPAMAEYVAAFGARLAWLGLEFGGPAIKTTPGLPRERHDYVSPGFARVNLAHAFPDRASGDPIDHFWPYLRREIPHGWSSMASLPEIGFLSLDEAHILHNSGLLFEGRPALEIGCWRGWSTAHLAASGVLLDVIDPVLGEPAFHAAVSASLAAVGAADRVSLHAGPSPQLVTQLAQARERAGLPAWELYFIDGDHEGEAPLRDAQACDAVAPRDAMMLFHDVVAPPVAAALLWLESRDWNIRLFQTGQIMGVAWRGAARPVAHKPDPTVVWTLPHALARVEVSGIGRPQPVGRPPALSALERALARHG